MGQLRTFVCTILARFRLARCKKNKRRYGKAAVVVAALPLSAVGCDVRSRAAFISPPARNVRSTRRARRGVGGDDRDRPRRRRVELRHASSIMKRRQGKDAVLFSTRTLVSLLLLLFPSRKGPLQERGIRLTLLSHFVFPVYAPSLHFVLCVLYFASRRTKPAVQGDCSQPMDGVFTRVFGVILFFD